MLARQVVLLTPPISLHPDQLPSYTYCALITPLESALLQVFILKNLKSIGINTYKKPGGGAPVCYQPLTLLFRASRIHLPFSGHSSNFRIPQVLCLPARRGGPLLRKLPGCGGILPILELASPPGVLSAPSPALTALCAGIMIRGKFASEGKSRETSKRRKVRPVS
jgi:hypothetical protein